MNDNPSVAPPADIYDPEMNVFGHAIYLAANPTRAMRFSDVLDYFDGVPLADHLSNFYPSPLRLPQAEVERLIWPSLWKGLEVDQRNRLLDQQYATGEAAFQAFKTQDIASFLGIAACADPSDAKMRGRLVDLRPDWPEIRVDVMRSVLAAKFSPASELADRLLGTGTAMLVEANRWSDDIWGVCEQTDGAFAGLNLLGVLLLERRGVLRAQTTTGV